MIRSPMPPRSAPIKRATTIRASGKRKASRPKMTPARSNAKGQPCMVRLPGVCNGDQATTVLAHYRLAGYCGTGIKPPDEFGAWACSDCHAEVDRRTRLMDTEYVRLCHAEAVMRTQYEMKGAK